MMVNDDVKGQRNEPNMPSQQRRDTPFIKLPSRPTVEEDFEEYTESDDEEYLDEDEPYGTFMKPSPNPYNRTERVDEANKALFGSSRQKRHVPTQVKIREENNKYYSDDETDTENDNTSTTSGVSTSSSQKSDVKRVSPPPPMEKRSSQFTANGDVRLDLHKRRAS
uniref:Uncharacterized protein n=1 Tax=Graphocephala atropunctata TaxID=36148 RepID=A0A1B6LL49_9HEMI